MRLGFCMAIALGATIGCSNTMKEAKMDTTTAREMRGTPIMKMQLDIKGAGAPLVLVGGGLTGMASWEPHQARLAGTRRVARAQPLAVQYGLENRPLPAGYSVRMESRALGLAVSDLDGGRVDVVAWSYGALIALDFALEQPDRVRSLTLIEPPAFWVLAATGMSDGESERESAEMRALYASLKGGDVTEEQLAEFTSRAGLCPPGKKPQDLPQWPAWVKHRRSLLTGDAVWLHDDSAARLHAFQRPVLLVKGTGSSHFLHRIDDALAKTLPRAEVLELPGGHAPQIVAMDAFLDRIAAFQSRAGG